MDDLTPQQRRCNMQHIKSRDTKPELTLRRALWHSGLRGHRKNYQALPGKPDIAYTRYKIAVFVDGEYFHGKDWNNGLKERTKKGANALYWTAKIERNSLLSVDIIIGEITVINPYKFKMDIRLSDFFIYSDAVYIQFIKSFLSQGFILSELEKLSEKPFP